MVNDFYKVAKTIQKERMVLRQLVIHMQKNKVRSYFTSHKNELKIDQRPKC